MQNDSLENVWENQCVLKEGKVNLNMHCAKEKEIQNCQIVGQGMSGFVSDGACHEK